MLYFKEYENTASHQAFTYLQHTKLHSLPTFCDSNSPSKALSLLLLRFSFAPRFQTGNSRICPHWIYEDEEPAQRQGIALVPIQKSWFLIIPRNPGGYGSPTKISVCSMRDKSGGLMNFLELGAHWPHTSSNSFLKDSTAPAVFPGHLFHSTCGNPCFMQMQGG